ncbi:MAG: carboxypeptidase-like regulatory domain-containing protein [Flavobacteriia bacterium]|nr:carboxypeptidase-like regulatory domain-containing protein [Flavobacteriia bacterium]
MKVYLFFLFSTFVFYNYSQVIKGKVLNAKGEPIPFAKIRIHKTSNGTVANAIGNYQLEYNAKSIVLHTSAMEYKDRFDTLVLNNEINVHNIVLQDFIQEMGEVVVVSKTKKDRGKEIMKKVIERRPEFYEQNSAFSCNTYCFGSLEKEVQDSLVKDSIIGKQSMNLLEWKARSYYKADRLFKDEFLAYNDYKDENQVFTGNSVSISLDGSEQSISSGVARHGGNEYLFCDGFKDVSINIFENQLSLPRLCSNPIISPLAYNAFIYYNFYLDTTFIDLDSNFIYQIEVKPKFKEEALFYGTLYILDEKWEIKSFDLGINPRALTFFKELRIITSFENVEGKCLPKQREFVYYVKEGRNKMNGSIKIQHDDYRFDLEDKKASFWLETKVFKEDAFDKDSSFWNESRPFTLKDFEKRFVYQQDSAILYHESDEYKRISDSTRNKLSFLNVIFEGIGHVNSFKKYELWFSPVIAQLIPFGVGGFRYRLECDFKKEFKNNHILTLHPKIDYGFYNEDLKGRIGASYMYNPLKFTKVFFDIGDDYDFVTSVQNIQGTFAPGNRVRNRMIEIGYRTELTNGLYAQCSFQYSNRESITNIKYPSWLDTIWGIFSEPQPFPQYKIFLTTFDFEYHFRQKYYIRKNKKIVLGTPWPVLYFQYKKGIPNLANTVADFDFIEIKVSDEAQLNTLGNLQTKFVFGAFLQKKDLRLIEYKFFRTSDYYFFSNPVNTLQLLDTTLNTSNSYLQFNFIHHFNGYFLNKIWLINKLKLEETIGGSMLYIPDAKFAQVEYYAGLERKLRIRRSIFKLGFYLVSSDSNLNKANFRFKIGVNFYDSFNGKWSY